MHTLSVGFFIPFIGSPPNSGGIRTLLRYIAALVDKRVNVTLYVDCYQKNKSIESQDIKNNIIAYNEVDINYLERLILLQDSYPMPAYAHYHDVAFATGWQTNRFVNSLLYCKRKILLMQDDETLFFNSERDIIRNNVSDLYKSLYTVVTLGHYNATILKEKYDRKAFLVNNLGIRGDIYYFDNSKPRNDTICMVYQKHKKVRMPLIIEAISKQVATRLPNVDIILFGDDKRNAFKTSGLANIKFAGVMDDNQLALLYNSCKVGVCLSSSNPSRISFEMMACGLPLIEWHGASYDIPKDCCFITNPSCIVDDIIQLYNDFDRQRQMRINGINLAAKYPLSDEIKNVVQLTTQSIWQKLDVNIGVHFHVGSINVYNEMKKYIYLLTQMFTSVHMVMTTFLNNDDFDFKDYNDISNLTFDYIHIQNRGMDIGGKLAFLKHAQKLVTHKTIDWFLFLHTKTNIKWRTELLDVCKPHILHALFTSVLPSNPHVGIIGSKKRLFDIGNANRNTITTKLSSWKLSSNDLYDEINYTDRHCVNLDPEFYLNYHDDLKLITNNFPRGKALQYAKQHWESHGKFEHERVPNPSLILHTKEKGKYKFIAGSIFWASQTYLEKLLQCIGDLDDHIHALEEGYITNIQETQTHAWEYLLGGILCTKLQMQILPV